jgi:hypothetical protein
VAIVGNAMVVGGRNLVSNANRVLISLAWITDVTDENIIDAVNHISASKITQGNVVAVAAPRERFERIGTNSRVNDASGVVSERARMPMAVAFFVDAFLDYRLVTGGFLALREIS